MAVQRRWTGVRAGLVLAGCTLAGCGEAAAPPPFAPGPPTNLILISVDTLRPDRLGAYGHERATSPTLDRLAEEGVLFTRAVAVSPWTLPSHASLLTGVYPSRHGARDYDHRVSSGVPALAKHLRAAGFETGAIVSSTVLGPRSGLERGFDRFQQISEWSSGIGGRRLRNPGADVTAAARAWLEAGPAEPFFLFLHYYDPHSDYAAREEFRARFVTPYAGEINGSTSQLLEVLAGARQLDAADLRRLLELYDAEIRQLDEELRSLLEGLDAGGLSGRTALLVTSDHGEEFMERGAVLHARTYFDEVIAVPLILRGAGVPRGMRSEIPASLVDVAPTLLSLVGLPVPPSMEGRDLSALWRSGAPRPGPRYVFAEADRAHGVPDRFRMVLDERYKLIADRVSGETQLYDLREDPGERHDLAGERPDLVRERLEALEAWVARGVAQPSPVDLSEEDREALRALGYAP